MINLKQQVRTWLDNHESAPSAFCLVKSIHDGRVTSDADCDLAYGRSNGENDTERNQLIDALTDQQMIELAAAVIEIADEAMSGV